jgi:hypothetical protein
VRAEGRLGGSSPGRDVVCTPTVGLQMARVGRSFKPLCSENHQVSRFLGLRKFVARLACQVFKAPRHEEMAA